MNPALAILLLLTVSLAGCASSRKGDGDNQRINQWLLRRQAELPPAEYRVEPPDVLLIVAPRLRELDQQQVAVRPDGMVSVPLLGDVQVSGRTPDEIARDLRNRASRFYDRDLADIRVQVSEFRSKVVYVFGQVHEPGIKPFTGRETLLAILAEARLNTAAWPQKIVIVRPDEDPTVRSKITVDVKQMYETGQTAQDYLLEQGDIVYIPPSPLASLGVTFNKLLIPMQPVSMLSFLTSGGI